MIFALLTLLAALAMAGVAGWFSIVGFMAIYAGAPMYALIMGIVTEAAKLVTISWLYRNWIYSNWRLKAPLIYFAIALMTTTSIGVFGFLSKAHLEQGAGTVNNSAKIEQLQYQIDREKGVIADNEKVISQLDATVNSFLGKDRTDKSLSVRRSQAPQRKQLRTEIDNEQKRIDELSTEKFRLESEIRKIQLDVGPIRYIAELFYGVTADATKNIESAVRIFTLLIVSTLDPLAVILLIAANHTLLRLKDEKEKSEAIASEHTTPGSGCLPPVVPTTNETLCGVPEEGQQQRPPDPAYVGSEFSDNEEICIPILQETLDSKIDEEKITTEAEDSSGVGDPSQIQLHLDPERLSGISENNLDRLPSLAATQEIQEVIHEEEATLEKVSFTPNSTPPPVIRQPKSTRVMVDAGSMGNVGQLYQEVKQAVGQTLPTEEISREIEDIRPTGTILRELIGTRPHFIPQKVNEDTIDDGVRWWPSRPAIDASTHSEFQESDLETDLNNKYPVALSWISEFKRP